MFLQTPYCPLHNILLGISKDTLCFTLESKQSGFFRGKNFVEIDERRRETLEQRVRNFPLPCGSIRPQGIFGKGYYKFVRWRGTESRSFLHMAVHVFYGLVDDKVLLMWSHLSRYKSWVYKDTLSNTEISKMMEEYHAFKQLFFELFGQRNTVNFHVGEHFPEYIKHLGVPKYWSTENDESKHYEIRAHTSTSNFRDVYGDLLKKDIELFYLHLLNNDWRMKEKRKEATPRRYYNKIVQSKNFFIDLEYDWYNFKEQRVQKGEFYTFAIEQKEGDVYMNVGY